MSMVVVRKTVRVRHGPRCPDLMAPLVLIGVLLPYALTIVYTESPLIRDPHTVPKHAAPAIRLLQHTTRGHNTTSVRWTPNNAQRKYIDALSRILAFRQHHCLCVHHLHRPNVTPTRVCGTAFQCASLPRPSYAAILYNPRVRARSARQRAYRERSISCPKGTNYTALRPHTLWLDWEDERGETMTGVFRGMRAACFALAMDEFEGNARC